MPRAFPTQRGEDRRFLGGPHLEQLLDFGAYIPPLLPETHAQAASQPSIQLWERAVVLREPKVLYPAPDVLVEFADTVGHRDAPTSPRELAQTVAKVLERFRGPVNARPLEGKAQEPAFIGGAHRTLALIDLQLQVLLEKASDTGFEVLARPLAFDDDEKV